MADARQEYIKDAREWLDFVRNEPVYGMARVHVKALLDIIDEQADSLGLQREEIRQLQDRLQRVQKIVGLP
jgi:hypothetical protein